MSPIFFRRTAQRMIQKLGVGEVTEIISDAALEVVRKIGDSEFPEEYGKAVGEDFISSCPKAGSTTTRTSPWILAPILEREGLAFRSYSPSKGEILSLYKHKNKRSEDSPEVGSMPWLMVPPAFDGGSEGAVYKLYSPTKGGGGGEVSLTNINRKEEAEFMHDPRTKLVGSSHGWLASFNDRTCDFFLSNPRSGRRIRLPSVPQERPPLKVIISCSPDDEEDHEYCRALMSFGHNRLAFCCPGEEELEWTPIGARHEEHFGLRCVRSYDDFVYSTTRKRFFAVLEGESNVVECWDLRDPQSPRLDWQSEYENSHSRFLEDLSKEEDEGVELPDKDWCRQVKYLVSADHPNQQLFLVTRYIMDDDDDDDNDNIEDSKTIGFDVHRIQGRKLHRMDHSLDGLVMFVGINHSFALEPSGQFKPNSIYFTHHKGAHDIGIFDYKNTTFCSYNLQRFKKIQPPPLWFYGGFTMD